MKVIYVDGHSRDTGPPFESDVSDSSGRVCASEARMLAVPYFMSSLRASGDAGLITCAWPLLYIGRLVIYYEVLAVGQLPDLPRAHSITLK